MVKRAGLRLQWLSAYAGSNPAPCIHKMLKIIDRVSEIDGRFNKIINKFIKVNN